jgi:hypothetical protein
MKIAEKLGRREGKTAEKNLQRKSMSESVMKNGWERRGYRNSVYVSERARHKPDGRDF